MKISVSRDIHFDAGHRIIGHEGMCKYLHGHRYTVRAYFTVNELDDLGRAIDFGIIKEKLGQWIQDNFDHNLILSQQDKELGEMVSKITKQKVFYLPYQASAENIAKYLLETICPTLFTTIKCYKIKILETPNCSATVEQILNHS